MNSLNRRTLLQSATAALFTGSAIASARPRPFFRSRGVVITPDDLTLVDWPDRAKAAGLTTIALHPTVPVVTRFIDSKRGQEFLDRCRKLGLHVEYELHAMSDLLPRSLFETHRALFRMNENGDRTPDANLCVNSADALAIAAENAVAIGRKLRPTTGRYFYWGDDGQPWCRCPDCRGFTDSDQALTLNNCVVKALRRSSPNAQLAHLAYHNTVAPPRATRPEPGVFLEFAPIHRTYDRPFAAQSGPGARDGLDLLDANLAVFPRDTAQALEYWLDLSRFSGWKRPAPMLPWRPEVFRADLGSYGSRGVRNLASFAVFLDADYVRAFGDPPLRDYGRAMKGWRPRDLTPYPAERIP